MSGVRDLCRTPPPRSDESLLGYLVRLTEENGYGGPNWILELAGIKTIPIGPTLSLVLSDFPSLSGLAEIAGVATEKLEALRYSPTSGGRGSKMHRFSDRGVLPQHLFNLTYCKLCPDCLREDGYCQRIWDLVLVTTCPRHGRRLLWRCPECGERIRWNRSRLSRCRCGCEWETSYGEEVADHELSLSEQIHLLAGLKRKSVDCQSTKEDNPLLGLDLLQLCGFVLFARRDHIPPEQRVFRVPFPVHKEPQGCPGRCDARVCDPGFWGI
jgi:hypothetical protein